MRRLGPYELIQPLGSGGMAEVWMGRRVAIGGASKTVAIKLMSAKVAHEPEFRRLFTSEARLSMLLNNSNIVQVFDVAEDDGECYMVMEWVDGLNLSQLCKRLAQAGERLPPVVTVYVIAEVLRGLSYAHGLVHDGVRTEVVHRDVSPQNVMLSVSGEVKLMDFGIARLSTEETSGVHIKGKLRYMPPEQLRGDARRPTVDLFAVGAMLHELLEGRRFRSQVVDEARLYGMILDGEVPPLELPGGHKLPRELEELHDGLLAANEADRIPSAKEALRLLYRWPGYRNCAMDIEALVQRFVGADAPRTSLQAPIVDSDGPAASHGGAAVMPPAAPVAVETPSLPATSVLSAADSASQHDTQQTMREGGHSSLVTVANLRADRGGLRSTAARASVVGLVVLGLGFGIGAAGVGLGWWGGAEPADDVGEPIEVADAAPAEPAPAEVAPNVVPPAAPEPAPAEPAPAEPSVEEPAPVDPAPAEAAPDEPPDEPAAPAKTSKAKPVSVSVELVANEYYYVEAKIAGRVYKLSPIAKARIRAGTHTLYLRQNADDGWKRAGRITLEPGKAHRVEMLDPAGARVSTQ